MHVALILNYGGVILPKVAHVDQFYTVILVKDFY